MAMPSAWRLFLVSQPQRAFCMGDSEKQILHGVRHNHRCSVRIPDDALKPVIQG